LYQFLPTSADSTTITSFGSIPGLNCENHFNAGGQTNSDTAPLIGASANQNQTWTSEGQNEMYIIPISGANIIRPTHTFALGPPNGQGCTGGSGPFDSIFTAQQSIMTVTQDRKAAVISSSMLGSLGTDVDAGIRADNFAVALDYVYPTSNQSVAPSAPSFAKMPMPSHEPDPRLIRISKPN
jgi:hypothetical protein